MTKKRGLGVGSMYYGIGYGFNRADIGSALIEMAEDGTTTVYSGACDMGQGVVTIVAQVAAEALGIRPDTVRVVAADTGQHARLRAYLREPVHLRAGRGGPEGC